MGVNMSDLTPQELAFLKKIGQIVEAPKTTTQQAKKDEE
jgi:hypothetical protein